MNLDALTYADNLDTLATILDHPTISCQYRVPQTRSLREISTDLLPQ